MNHLNQKMAYYKIFRFFFNMINKKYKINKIKFTLKSKVVVIKIDH